MYSPELPPPFQDLLDQGCLSPPSSDSSDFCVGKDDGDDRSKKRQVRLMKNRQSAALSRHRKKEYIGKLETRAQELQLSTHELHQNVTMLAKKSNETKLHIEMLEKQLLKVILDTEQLKSKFDESCINNNLENISIRSNNNSIESNIINNNSNKNNNSLKSEVLIVAPKEKLEILRPTTPTRQLKSNDEIIIGMNKMMHYQQQQQQIHPQQQVQPQPPQPFLSISNPNVNSSPNYLSRARASSYHPSNDTYTVHKQILQQQQSNLPSSSTQSSSSSAISPSSTSPTNNSFSPLKSFSDNTGSPVLPSLHQITKGLSPPISPSNRASISIPSGSSPIRQNLLGSYHFTQQQKQQ